MKRRQFLQSTLLLGTAGLLPGFGSVNNCLGDALSFTEPMAPTTSNPSVEAENSPCAVHRAPRRFSHRIGKNRIFSAKYPPKGTHPIVEHAVRGDLKSVKRCLVDDPSSMEATGDIYFGCSGFSDARDSGHYVDLPLPQIIASWWCNNEKGLRYLASRGAKLDCYQPGGTPLCFAIKYTPNLSAIQYLISEVGADVNVRCSDGESPLHSAVVYNSIEVVNYLISKGADDQAKLLIHAAVDSCCLDDEILPGSRA